ncbi:MAG: alpha/beta hydrolase [Myxococcota bacterium]
MIALWWFGCFNLDSLIYNPIHCSDVNEDTCEGIEEPFDRACLSCDEPYDWQRDYDWIPGTLEEGQTVRPIDPSLITPVPIATDDGEATLDAYFIASHGEDPLLADVTLVYNHGRYLGIEHYQPRLRFLHEAGYNVFVWDFRGYGKSVPNQVPTTDQQITDAGTVIAEARKRAPNLERVAVYAYSLGTFPAVHMLDEDICTLLLESSFPSLADAAEFGTRLSLPEQFLSSGQLDNREQLATYAGPVFGMIGTEDEVVPGPEVQREMVEAGGGPSELWVAEGASHGLAGGGIPEDMGLTMYFDQMRNFVEEYCP